MCGIVGIVSRERHSTRDATMHCLRRLEYRGYDSVGVASGEGDLSRATGGIGPFLETLDGVETTRSIAHTRWATHGGVTVENAHPHSDEDGTFMLVHNGIIENTEELLEELGHPTLKSETDSEVIAVWFRNRVEQGGRTVEEAIREFFKVAEGTFAVLLMKKGDDCLYAFCRDSPLTLGHIEEHWGGGAILASDLSAFGDLTAEVTFFEDNHYCVITAEACTFYDRDGRVAEPAVQHVEWVGESELADAPHYMIKEIMEQPVTSARLLQSLDTIQSTRLSSFADSIRKARRVVFVSCGTSYHASLIGAHLLSTLGYEAHTVIASEFESFILVDPSTFVIALSQSGETMDVILPLKHMPATTRIGSIVNVPYSTIQRLSDITLELCAGPEISVASTKAFTNQVLALIRIVEELGYDTDSHEVPGRIESTLKEVEEASRALARDLKDCNDLYVLGKGAAYPMAREMALKIKEIDYIHAEGMMAGELKHGTLALIEEGTPVICLVPDDDKSMLSSTQEVAARGARTIVISNTGSGDINVPAGCRAQFGIYACLFGHLLSYHIGLELGLPIDKPRNLAKSVTVV